LICRTVLKLGQHHLRRMTEKFNTNAFKRLEWIVTSFTATTNSPFVSLKSFPSARRSFFSIDTCPSDTLKLLIAPDIHQPVINTDNV
jgi:hypothetical protein